MTTKTREEMEWEINDYRYCRYHGAYDALRRNGCPGCLEEKTDRAKLALYDEMVEALKAITQLKAYTEMSYEDAYEAMFKRWGRPAWDKVYAVLAKVKEIK